MGSFMQRDELIPLVRRLYPEWHYDHDVRFGTTYLVASRTGTSKAHAARRMGVTVLSYADFWRLLEGQRVSGGQLPLDVLPTPLGDILYSPGVTSPLEAERLARRQVERDRIAARDASRASVEELRGLPDDPPPPSNMGERVRKITL